MTRFILFQRDDCHLCDLALDVLAGAGFPEFESVFIDDDAALEMAYGARVPVLRDAATGSELEWPFDARGVAGWVNARPAPDATDTLTSPARTPPGC